jgi:hypothetical protein
LAGVRFDVNLELDTLNQMVMADFSIMYLENDKVMLLTTGEVLTVMKDFSDELERGIVVRENIGRNLMTSEVRAAGRTRERAEAGQGVEAPEPFPPPMEPTDL